MNEVHRNVTLSLPEPLLRRFRVYAAGQNRSMTALAAEAIERMLDERGSYEAAKRRFLKRIERPVEGGVGDKIPWTRDELHER